MTCKHDPLIYTQVKPADQGHFNARIAAKCSKCGAEAEIQFRFAFDIPQKSDSDLAANLFPGIPTQRPERWSKECACGASLRANVPHDITCGCGLIHHYQDTA